MIQYDGLTARKHMLTDVGHEKTRGKPEPYQHVEHRAEQPRERCEQVGSGSGPEPKRRQHWHLVPRPCLARALSHDHGVASPCSSATERPVVSAGWRSYVRQQQTADGKPRSMLSPFPRRAVRCDFAFAALARSLE